MRAISRRRLLGGAAVAGVTVPVLPYALPGAHPDPLAAAGVSPGQTGGHSSGRGSQHGGGHEGPTFQAGAVVDHAANGFHPTDILRDFDYGTVTRLPGGRVLREYEMFAQDKEIEVAPGVRYPAWTYNGRIPGPTLRATEGDLMRVRFVNGSEHPHTIHFHGFHTAEMDGVPGIGAGTIPAGGETTYEFEAEPFGLHLYHCHVGPLAEHIARGLYGAYICDPKPGRPEADEMVMVMNGFNTNFDAASNQTYAINTVAFHHMNEPIEVARGELLRIYLVNTLEYDPINSFHVHANFFDYYPTGTRLEPRDLTDTVVLGQGERGILELRFKHRGDFMFHAHKTEFAELGWMGMFRVV
ncbi:MAG: multicopper oxidase domain-containing protein [Actinomycetota bacterium]|nr:multicopper oxidase domain-containing protein [Actinomycetota bacterium]